MMIITIFMETKKKMLIIYKQKIILVSEKRIKNKEERKKNKNWEIIIKEEAIGNVLIVKI